MLKRSLKLSKLKSQKGEVLTVALLGLIVSILVLILVIIIFLSIVFVVTGSKTNQSSSDATGGGQVAKGDTNNLPAKGDSNNKFSNTNTNNLPAKNDDTQDLSTGYLVCVNLPGVDFPRTPALDRKVAQMYLAVKKDLDAQGVPGLRFSWGFRSNCQQINVKPSANPRGGANPKAKPGTSPHEAGRGVDVRDMTRRRDVGQIVATFERHGWHWLAQKDPPHFEVKGYTVGEPSHSKWIAKIQQSFKEGYPKEGCRGPECGE